MIDWKKNIEEKLKIYLNSKYSDNTKNYITAIITFLNKPDKDGLPLPVKSGDLQKEIVPDKIPYLGLYYRLLKELQEEGIIIKEIGEREPRKRGKNPTYYRLVVLHKLKSYNEMGESNSKCIHALKITIGRLSAAYELLEEQGIDPDEAINRRYELIRSPPYLTPFSFTDEEIKAWGINSIGISRIHPKITIIQ